MNLKPAPAYHFQSIGPMSRWLGFLLIADIVMSVVGFGSTLLEREVLNRVAAAQDGDLEDSAYVVLVADAERSDLLQLIVGCAQIAVALVTLLVFCRWIYVAARNCHARYEGKLDFTPGWSVGWYFVPVANLWKPFQAMRQILNVSENPSGDPQRVAPGMLFAWWALFLFSNAVGRAAFNHAMKAEEISELQASNTFTLFSDGTNIFATLAAYFVVKNIASLQAKNFTDRPPPSSGSQETEPSLTA